jgi:hypothetical protein
MSLIKVYTMRPKTSSHKGSKNADQTNSQGVNHK